MKSQRISWSYVVVLAIIMMSLAGCGNSGLAVDSKIDEGTATKDNKQETPVSTGDTRTIQDAYGDVQVPMNRAELLP